MNEDAFSEAARLFPKLSKFRKLILAILAAVIPYVLLLVSGPQPAYAIVGGGFATVLALFGVYRVPNAYVPRR